MSKLFAAAFFALPLILQIFNNCFGQNADVSLTVRSVTPPIVEIRGRYAQSSVKRNFSLINDSAGFSDLAKRFSDIRLEDNDGKAVAFKQFIPGEYVAANDFVGWRYTVDLTPEKRWATAAHVSWIGPNQGVLFVDDLLPLQSAKECGSLSVTVKLPDGWTAFGNENNRISCSDKVVYFLTRRSRQLSTIPSPVDLIISGDWKFTDQQAVDFVGEIYSAYKKLFGGEPPGRSHIYLLSFPAAVTPGTWEADTRGRTVTILSSDMPFQTQSVQRLHEQLRHEIFHLWMPNAIHLKGNYDWFYEGFALYESLKLGVEVNRLRFDDYLDTLSRAMTVDAAMTDRRSLITASDSRQSGNDTLIYARGMLIAFLTDLKILSRSGGKRDVSELLRSLYEKYRDPKNEADGNQVVTTMIGDAEIRQSIENGETINWASALKAFGIEREEQAGSVLLRVTSKPSGSQKKLLDRLGYNNWRNSSVGPK